MPFRKKIKTFLKNKTHTHRKSIPITNLIGELLPSFLSQTLLNVLPPTAEREYCKNIIADMARQY